MRTPTEPKPPVVLSYAPAQPKPVQQGRLLEPLAILALGTAIGVALGAILNGVNFEISSTYFAWQMPWLTADSFAYHFKEGANDGLLPGYVVGAVFSWIMGSPAYMKSRFRDVLPYILSIALVVMLAWLLGGITGAAMTAHDRDAFFPNHYRPAIRQKSEFIRYGWVYGATCSVEVASLLSACFVPVVFCVRWRHRCFSLPQYPGGG